MLEIRFKTWENVKISRIYRFVDTLNMTEVGDVKTCKICMVEISKHASKIGWENYKLVMEKEKWLGFYHDGRLENQRVGGY